MSGTAVSSTDRKVAAALSGHYSAFFDTELSGDDLNKRVGVTLDFCGCVYSHCLDTQAGVPPRWGWPRLRPGL